MSKPLRMHSDQHRQILQLFKNTARQHLHLEWRSFGKLLQHPGLRGYVIKKNGGISAIMSVLIQQSPGQPAPIAWLKMAASQRLFNPNHDLDLLWQSLLAELHEAGVNQVGLLAVEKWIEPLAKKWGFDCQTTVVTLCHNSNNAPRLDSDPALRLREAKYEDLEQIARVDEAAFLPLWRYTLDTLEVAFSQAAYVTIVEYGDALLGYQLSTYYGDHGHLARLAVIPESQGLGIGRYLVEDMLAYLFEERSATQITVNTQVDNERSRRLYAHLGFDLTDHRVPVWTLSL